MNSQTLITSPEEYLFLRQEILQYLNNYQSVRDMMYGSTLSCLGLGLFFEDAIAIGAQYLFLLPLVVIVPSFLVAVNYWKCVMVDACYLRVFYEEPPDGKDVPKGARVNFRWETRHAELFRQKPELDDKVNVQHIPYVVCTLACLGLFWWETLAPIISGILVQTAGGEANGVLADGPSVLMGTIVTLLCLLIFLRHRKLDTQVILDKWRDMKKAEQSANIKSK